MDTPKERTKILGRSSEVVFGKGGDEFGGAAHVAEGDGDVCLASAVVHVEAVGLEKSFFLPSGERRSIISPRVTTFFMPLYLPKFPRPFAYFGYAVKVAV